MRLLVFTQAVDKNDPVLGFFHGWLAEFAKKFEKITVIALRVGESSLPSNIKTFSLSEGKNRKWRVCKIARLFFLLWKTRHAADAVFVHMNKEYVLAGWPLWWFFHTPIYFWYNHGHADWFAKLAMKLSKKVFYTSENSAGARFPNAVQMPVGVDTELFKPSPFGEGLSARGPSVLSLGRIDSVKKIDVLAKAILLLAEELATNFQVTIAGSPSWGNEKYAASIRETLKPLADKGVVRFIGSLPHEKTSELFNQHRIFINLTPSGSLDKTILEAMACGCLVIASNQSVWNIVGEEGRVSADDPNAVAEKIKASLALPLAEVSHRSKLNHDFVLKNHSLKILVNQLVEKIKAI
jgi:glycosyltransferase involved in cell wall biosynthesis